MSDNNQSTLRIYEFPRATLFTQAPGVERERASFAWSTLNGNPRITVWTRVPDDKDKGLITAGIGITAVIGTFTAMREVFQGNSGKRMVVDTLVANKDTDAGERSFGKQLGSSLHFGKNEQGICWISLVSADEHRPKIIFEFKGFDWHPFRGSDGNPIDPIDMSRIHAMATVNYLEAMFNGHDKGVTPEERKAFSERMSARRGTKSGGQRPQQAKPAADAAFMEDFAF